MLALLLALHLGVAGVVFLALLVRPLKRRIRRPIHAALGVQFLVLLGFLLMAFGWAVALASLAVAPLYALATRSLAARYAKRLLG